MLEFENRSTRVTNHSISVYNNLAREALSQGIKFIDVENRMLEHRDHNRNSFLSWLDTFTVVPMFNDPEFSACRKKVWGSYIGTKSFIV